MADDEAPFTWEVSSGLNYAVENTAGDNEHWILSGSIIDPNGLDVTSKFTQGKRGPLYFDFKAPARTNSSQIAISSSGNPTSWGPTSPSYYPDAAPNGAAFRFRITEMSDMGVGHVYGSTSAIAVGDCSVRGNDDTRGSTAFTPLDEFDNVTHISQLPEEDPDRDAVNDGGGIDCYVAEVQSLADRLGNAVNLSRVPRIRTATTFGVDRTPPVISRERPSDALVLNGNELSFEIEDPRFESGEDGSGQRAEAFAYAGDSRYWVTGNHYWSDNVDMSTGSATVDITATSGTFAREIEHTVYIRARDVAGNSAFTSFTFTRDHSDPVLSLSEVPSDFGLTQAASVSVTVAGTLTDATEIRRAFLSVHHGTECVADTDRLESSQAANPVRRLHNGTNKIEFSEVFTIKKAGDLGATDYCFFLSAEDDARDADGGANENDFDEIVGTFSVTWPGTKPVGPVAVGAISNMDLAIGGMDTRDVTANFSDANGDALTYMAASSDGAVATVSMAGAVATVTAVAAGTATITVTASDGGTGTAEQSWNVTVAAAPPPTVYGLVFTDADDDPLTMVEVDEGSGSDGGTTYKVALDRMPSDDVTVAIAVAEANRAVYATLSVDELTFTSANYMTAQEVTVTTLDHDANTTSEPFTLTHDPSGAEYESAATANVAGMVNDDEVWLSTSIMSLSESADTTEVTLTVSTGVADDDDARSVSVTFLGGDAIDGDFNVLDAAKAEQATVVVSIPLGETSKDTTLYIVPIDDELIGGVSTDESPTEDIGFTTDGNITYSPANTAPASPKIEAVVHTEVELTDADPDVTVSVDQQSIAEDAGEQTVTVTVAAGDRVGADRVFTVTFTGGDGAVQYTTSGLSAGGELIVTIPPGETMATETFRLTPTDDTANNADRTIGVTAALPAGTTKPNSTVGYSIDVRDAQITLVNDDDS
ncbi:MAG: Ig-like domain-containing protein [Gemmatimonadetes bacterium]|nr:Ig-like domain-containing protein [Candidatus Palauibacter rhopaloidicola]